jgi:hypothetical protein
MARPALISLAAALILLFASMGQPQTPTTNGGSEPPTFRVQVWGDTVADFSTRISRYAELRSKLEKGLPALLLEVNENTWAAIMDDNPGEFSHQINGGYSKRKPLSTVPPNILAVLPTLPDDIQYRFVGRPPHPARLESESDPRPDSLRHSMPEVMKAVGVPARQAGGR